MSRGLGKLQRAVLQRMRDGNLFGDVFALTALCTKARPPRQTPESYQMGGFEYDPEDVARWKSATASVRRALSGLEARGYLYATVADDRRKKNWWLADEEDIARAMEHLATCRQKARRAKLAGTEAKGAT